MDDEDKIGDIAGLVKALERSCLEDDIFKEIGSITEDDSLVDIIAGFIAKRPQHIQICLDITKQHWPSVLERVKKLTLFI